MYSHWSSVLFWMYQHFDGSRRKKVNLCFVRPAFLKKLILFKPFFETLVGLLTPPEVAFLCSAL